MRPGAEQWEKTLGDAAYFAEVATKAECVAPTSDAMVW
jgi:hypothetical protein